MLVPLADRRPQVRGAEQLPLVERDLAIVVRRDAAAGKVDGVIRANAGPNLSSVSLFDRYTGAPLGDDEVSLAYRLRFQPDTEQLSEAQLDEAISRVTNALEKEVGGKIRAG